MESKEEQELAVDIDQELNEVNPYLDKMFSNTFFLTVKIEYLSGFSS